MQMIQYHSKFKITPKYFVQEKMGESNVSEESSLYTDVNWRTVEEQ